MGDAELFVSRHAAQALVACAASGVAPLRLLLDDDATLGVLGGLGGAGGPGPGARQAVVLQLRVLEMWAEASATGEEQCALLVERGMLAPLEQTEGNPNVTSPALTPTHTLPTALP